MPLYHMKEIWTPLTFIKIKFFKSENSEIFIKIGRSPRKKVNIF